MPGGGIAVGNIRSAARAAIAMLLRSRRSAVEAAGLAAVARLSATVAHEIGNPLAAAMANVEFLRDSLPAAPDAPQARAAVADTLAALERIRWFVADLAAFTESDAVPLPSSPAEAIDDALRIVAHRLVPGSIRLIREVPAELSEVRIPRGRLVQILGQLLANAADALGGRKDGWIRISAVPRGDRLAIAVEDNGPGVPPSLRGRLFRPFATTKPPGPGMGLGLALARSFVERLGGTLRYEDRPGGGARFLLEVPVVSRDRAPVGTAGTRRRRR
jgi:C4-dicarboxylate-specific signal transduction histidine kinase